MTHRCVFCGEPTNSMYRVCLDHHDLIKLDPLTPAALVEPRERTPSDELAAELSPLTLGSTSAAALGNASAQPSQALALPSANVPPERTNGDLPGAFALDSSGETA